MKIWLDLRFIADNIYSTFVIEVVKGIIEKDIESNFTLYTNRHLDWFVFQNVVQKIVWIKNFTLKEQTTYLKILKHDNNSLMLFFNHYKPIFYAWIYFILLPSLKDIYYSNFNSSLEKYTYLYLLEKNLKKSEKIICLDIHTIDELIEKYNIEERKIKTLQWFFPNIHDNDIGEELKINIKTKYGIKSNFFIYSGWEWVEKNYEKLVHVFNKLKNDWLDINLVFLWEAISKNVSLRNIIINLDIQNHVHFIWIIKQNEKVLFYKESMWVIFPSLYEPFPFRLSEPLHFNTPIISSDLKNIHNIFWNSLKYFSAISVNNIYENIKKYINSIDTEKHEFKDTYKQIKSKYSKEKTIEQLLEILK